MDKAEYDADALSDDEEEDHDGAKFEPTKEQLVILIDAQRSMLGTHAADGARTTFMETAVDVATYAMKQRIQDASSDEVAVMFYGAGSSNAEAVFNHVYTYAPMAVPDAATIRKLQDFTVEQFKAEVGVTDPVGSEAAEDLRFCLWAAQAELKKRSSKSFKRVWLFTACEDPCAGPGVNERSRDKVLSRAAELRVLGAALDVFPLAALSGPFDAARFWADVVGEVGGAGDSQDDDGAGGVLLGLSGTTEEDKVRNLYEMARRRSTHKRPLASLRWWISEELQIGVQMFALQQPAVRKPPIQVTARDYEALRTSTRYMTADIGELLSDTSMRYFALTTGDTHRFPKVVMSTHEVREVKQLRPPGLALLGFKPMACLAQHQQLRPPAFLYPHERALRGSTAAFVALHAAMLQEGRYALARFVRGMGGAPVLVALVAQEEEVDDLGQQVTPPGMHVVFLPFQDDVRAPEADPAVVGPGPAPRADAAQVAAAGALLAALELPPAYEPGVVANPVLARHYDVIERIALDEPLPNLGDPVEDDSLPDSDGIMSRAGGLISAFSAACLGAQWAAQQGAKATADGKKGTKRAAPADDQPTPAEEYAQHDWVKLATEGGLSKLTIDKLKVYLHRHRLQLSGNKAAIVLRITNHVLAGG